jgi:TolB protein
MQTVKDQRDRGRRTGLACLPALLLAGAVHAGEVADPAMPIHGGDFEAHGDIGTVRTAGSVDYDEKSQTWTLTGSGTNMWADSDEFQFVWRRMRGDFIVTADAELLGAGVEPHRKMGWMIRSDLGGDSTYVDVALHGDGLTSLQFRRDKGAATDQIVSAVSAPDVLQLERRNGRYIMSVAKRGERFSTVEFDDIELPDEVYVGLFICAHNAEVVESGRFSNVRVTVPAPAGFRPYTDYYGSRLEIMDVDTGLRRVVHEERDSLQAPNWTRDGSELIYNRNGLLYRFDLATGSPSQIDTGFATRNNNDHVISFDGTRLGISHHSQDHDGVSMVYTMPLDGGTPTLVTRRGPSYFHGWSPDGQWLTFTGGRDGAWDIYKIRADGSADEIRLTTDPALDDGSEFSPDGAWIYFNSSRTGTMEIWRMKPDGSGQEQLTSDEYNNWFPHVAPDGKSIVYLAYMPDVAADEHPWYRHVYLMMMPVDGGAAKVIASLYGGQGTINVPSWSPDSKRIAFVSNSVL